MKKVEPDQTNKEKVLQMLASLSPTSRKAVLLAALELRRSKQMQQKTLPTETWNKF